MSENKLPLIADELTTSWLQEVLPAFDEISSITHEIIGVGEGFMGQLARVSLTFTDPASQSPGSLIAKFAATRQDTRDMAADQSLYQREIGFYLDIGTNCGVPIADCYFAEYIPATNHFVLLLEDLSPGEPTDQVIGADRETSREVIEQFARLHAKWWNDETLHDYEWSRWILKSIPMEQSLEIFEKSLIEVEAHGKFLTPTPR